MGQRLVRVKTKIRDAGMRFEVPGPDELAPRLGSVLGAIYAAYGSGWDDVAGADTRRRGLAEEAIWLGRLVARLLADEPETLGLLALMLHCEARRAARRDAAGAYVPLSEQDVSRWARPMIDEAEEVLRRASRAGRPGRFQLEAAVQSAHAAALAETRGAEAGLAALVAVPAAAVVGYQPFWALRGHLLGRLRRVDEAAQAYARAIALGEDPAVRRFLEEKACVLRTG
jgi:RNA polymerase sigma-70 factor (ECF subfamily)